MSCAETDREWRSLADYQLARLIERGRDVALCQAEWERRWGQAYPGTLIPTGEENTHEPTAE